MIGGGCPSKQAAGALWTLTVSADNQQRAGVAGALEVLSEILRMHQMDAPVQQAALGAVCNICWQSPQLRHRALSCGCHERARAAAAAHAGDEAVQAAAAAAAAKMEVRERAKIPGASRNALLRCLANFWSFQAPSNPAAPHHLT